MPEKNSITLERAIELLKSVVAFEAADCCELSYARDELFEMGFSEEEIVALDGGYLLDEDEED